MVVKFFDTSRRKRHSMRIKRYVRSDTTEEHVRRFLNTKEKFRECKVYTETRLLNFSTPTIEGRPYGMRAARRDREII